jgi:hypothetical protein
MVLRAIFFEIVFGSSMFLRVMDALWHIGRHGVENSPLDVKKKSNPTSCLNFKQKGGKRSRGCCGEVCR